MTYYDALLVILLSADIVISVHGYFIHLQNVYLLDSDLTNHHTNELCRNFLIINKEQNTIMFDSHIQTKTDRQRAVLNEKTVRKKNCLLKTWLIFLE